MVYPTLHFR